MKNLNLFRKSARGSEGSTLASTVVRPSFDRRNWRLKHIAFMLLFLLGSLNVWGAEADVTYDFTGSDWTVSNGTLSNGTVSFTGEGSANFKMNSGYFILGKSGAYITFPAYQKAVEKIVVTGKSGASGSTKMNIFVGDNAVSTETTGSTGTNTYAIASANQAAGTIYKLKVTSAHNAQITKIEIYYVAEAPTTPTIAADLDEIDFGEKNIYFAANKTGNAVVKVTGSNLTEAISATLGGTNAGKFSLSSSSLDKDADEAELTVSYSIDATGDYAATLTLSSEGATSVVIPITLKAISENVVVDVLTRETTGVTGTSYTAWSGKTLTSEAVYAGGSAGGNNSIQIRQDNSKKDAGIYTTTSGGKVKKVVIDWNTNTADARTLNVYGKNTAYTALSDLYGTETQGELLGTIVKGTSTELVITGDYMHIGLRATGAMYLNSVSISWTPAVKSAVTKSVENGTLDITGAADLSSVAEGTELTVTVTPDGNHTGGTIKVTKTGVTPEADVTDEVYAEGVITMPDYAITVSATFEAKTCEKLGTPDVSTSEITYNSAKLSWAAVDNADHYVVKIGEDEQEVNVNEYEASGLTASTQYTYQVKAIAADAQEDYCDGDYSAAANFNTIAAPTATLTLSENGATAAFGNDLHVGDEVTLPSTAAACAGVDFLGWSATSECTSAPEFNKGGKYILEAASQTLYAVYGVGGSTSYKATALADIASGSEVVIVGTNSDGDYAMSNDKAASAAPTAVAVTIEEGAISGTVAENIKWTLSGNATDGYMFYPNGDTEKWLYCTNTNNGVRVGTGEAKHFTVNNGFLYESETANARYLGIYNSQDWRCYDNINSNISGQTLAFYKKTTSYTSYSTTCTAALADPEFELAEGTYTETKFVTITADEGDIYYTINGDDPTSTSTKYEKAIELNANGTYVIKAIAISETSQSAVVTKTYTINLPLTKIQQLQEHANGSVNFKFENILVTAVTSVKQAFISDGTYGAIIYINTTDGHGVSVGDLINSKSGTAYTTTLTKYNGAAELTVFDVESADLEITSDQTVPVQNKAITDLSVANIGMIVDLGNLTYDAANNKFTDAGSNEIAYYDAYKLNLTLEDGAVYAVKGLVNRYNETLQISPRSTDDMVKQTSKEAPSAEWFVDNTEAESISGTYRIEENADFNPYFKTNSDGTKTFASSNTGVAQINQATGALTIVGTGTTEISCAIAESENYFAKAATSFTLVVRPEGSGEATWVAETWGTDNEISNGTKFTEENGIASFDAAENISFVWSKNGGSNDPAYYTGNARLYTKNQLTITSSNGKIMSSIKLTFTTTGYKGTISASEGNYTTESTKTYGEWTGFASSVIFTNSGDAARISQIDIEYVEGTTTTLTIEDIVLKMTEPDAKDIEYNSNKENPAIVYSGFDGNVISIENGKIAPVAVGETTVTASIAAEAPYSSATTTFKVTVKSGTEVETNVVILAQYNDQWYAMKREMASGNKSLVAVPVEYKDGKIFDLTPDEQTAITWTRIADESSVIFKSGNQFLYGSTGGADLKLQDASATWNWYENGGYYRNGQSTRTFIYREGYEFKNYGVDNAGTGTYSALPVVVEAQFANRAELRSGLYEGKWGTICPDHRVNYPTGASFYTLTYLQMENEKPYKLFFDEIETDYLEAGKPYLFIAEGEVIKGIKVGDEVTEAANYNGFYGNVGNNTQISTSQSAYVADGNVINYYGLTNNTFTLLANGTKVAHERAVVQIKNGQLDCQNPPQYLPAPRFGARRVVAGNNAPQVATGVDQVPSDQVPNTKVLIDGQLFILHGEKMYNANGQLVK